DDKQLAKLIEQLGDDDAEVRKSAEKKLTEIGEPALDLLRKAARDSRDADVKLHALALVKLIEKSAFASIRQFTGHTGHIRHLAVSKDGKKALTASMDYSVRLWDVDTGKEVRKFDGHTSWAWSVAFSPDEKHVLSSGSLDRTLRLWNVADGKEV